MTRLYIDKHEVPAPAISSLDQVLNYVEAKHLPPDTVIRQVQVDGNPLLPEDLHRESPVLGDACQGKTIEIFTGSIREIAIESIREAIDYLARLEDVTLSLARNIRRRPDQEAFLQLKQFYEGFYWLNLLVDRLSTSFSVPLADIQVDDTSGAEFHGTLISILKELIDSHEKGDTSLAADLLEYEIVPILPRWSSIFLDMQARISGTG